MAVALAPAPWPPNRVLAVIGGTSYSLGSSVVNSIPELLINAVIGAVVSYLTGLLLKRVFEKGGPEA